MSLALKLLVLKRFILYAKEQDYNGNDYFASKMSDAGVEWLLKNQEKLILQKENEKRSLDDSLF